MKTKIDETQDERNATLHELEERVLKGEHDGLRGRWDSGRYLLTLRKGKLLPRGVRQFLSDSLHVHNSEITARMKFAEKFPTDEALATVISKYRTWFNIKQQALTDTPRAQMPRIGRPGLQRMLLTIEELDPAMLTEDSCKLLKQIDNAIHRIIEGASRLKAA